MGNNYTFDLEIVVDNLENTGAFLTSGNQNKANTMTISPSKIVGSPIVEGCNRYYECKVVFKQTIDSSKIDKETHYKDEEVEHTLYFGEIVAQYS